MEDSGTVLNIGLNLLGNSFNELGYETHSAMDLINVDEVFDYAIVADEWFTFAETEDEQKEKAASISKLVKKKLVTTLKDYRNMHPSMRAVHDPFVFKNKDKELLLIRQRHWSHEDRQRWIETSLLVDNDIIICKESMIRRTMYFKQLAKFLIDNGALNIVIEKKIMYKSLFARGLEYIITAQY